MFGNQSKFRNQESKLISMLTKEADVTTEGGSVLAINTA
jgi:shikimate kinase